MSDPDPTQHRSVHDEAMAPPPAFRMQLEPSPEGIRLLVLAGEIDLATSGGFRAELDAALAEEVSLVADFAEVAFMDSTMLRELLAAHRELGAAGRRFVLAAPQPAILRLLDLTGTSGFFLVAPTRDEALALAGSQD
jgi:anti-anti-sigma factor